MMSTESSLINECFTTNEIRQKWISFFKTRVGLEHKIFESASLIPDNPTLLLNAAGMVPFVPYFLGTSKLPDPPRAVSIQKCARVGGKDSDLTNIGRTTRHHSFFEMLGNFSFGNYFKKDAIHMAWDFITQELKLDKNKLYFSIFEGDENIGEDTEAYKLWTNILKENYNSDDLSKRIWKMPAKDNFWGPPGQAGPCGPCSEIYYDLGEHISNWDNRYIEIWNLVFMQYEKLDNGSFIPLKQQNIDTGAGLERLAMVCQQANNTFETDELQDLVIATTKLLNIDYEKLLAQVLTEDQENQKLQKILEKKDDIGTLTKISLTVDDPKNNIFKNKYNNIKIIADHIRCAVFLIADGVRPSNIGRGYVLRMLIRRAARFVFLLQKLEETENQPILNQLSKTVCEIYGIHYKELLTDTKTISNILKKEEVQFSKTIEQGTIKLHNKLQEKADEIPIVNQDCSSSDNFSLAPTPIVEGSFIFDLYSTYGFPLELTEEIISARGYKIDYEGYEAAKAKHSEASSTEQFNVSVGSDKDFKQSLLIIPETKFLGYEQQNNKRSKLLAIIDSNNTFHNTLTFDDLKNLVTDNNEAQHQAINIRLIFDASPFYAESGGQIGDNGFASQAARHNDKANFLFKIDSCKKIENRYIHSITVKLPELKVEPRTKIFEVGSVYDLQVNTKDLNMTKKHHSSCHLLQSALRQVLGSHVQQAGSLVNPDFTRFDFSHDKAMTKEEIQATENLINTWIDSKLPVKTKLMAYDDAIESGALAFFEDKYEGNVRVLHMGSDTETASIELCGGIHVNNLSEIENVKIVSESSVASGVRRIKLLCSNLATEYIKEEVIKAEAQKKAELQKAKEKEAAKAKAREELQTAITQIDHIIDNAEIIDRGGFSAYLININSTMNNGLSFNTIKDLTEILLKKLESNKGNVWLLITNEFDAKLNLIISCSKIVAQNKDIAANTLIKPLASICKGGGGGRPDFAQAGCKDSSQLDALFDKAREIINEQ